MKINKVGIAIIVLLSVMVIRGCKNPTVLLPPPEDRFRKVVIAQGKDVLQGAIGFDFGPDGRIYLIHLTGQLKIFDPLTKAVKVAGVFDGGEYGLIGLKLDPDFKANSFVYLQYFVRDTTTYADSLRRRTMRISRFTVVKDSIDITTEKNYLRIPYEHECCHTGGGMDFDPEGNLYISTGDNTGAFFTQYAPTVLLDGHLIDDGLRSAGNTNDYRGKILRIHPEKDGSYAIPKGNLFPPGTPGAKPEIYIMGVRNPYRLTIDDRTGYLLWGEVGPDAGRDSSLGPRGYDEFNVTDKAGNFGWPLVIANNKPYMHVEYTGKAGLEEVHAPYTIKGKVDTLQPVNFSPHNTGLRDLPPSTPAFIWYPYDSADIFPSLGAGGRTAICGPVYNYDPALQSTVKFPAYFDHCWFIADWMRDWVKAVHFTKDNRLKAIEDFLPGSLLKKPVCMQFGPDGALYLLEYGSTWGDSNEDVQLSRIEYIPGNRPPVAVIKSQEPANNDPLTISLTAATSFDPDGDALQYSWKDSAGHTSKAALFSMRYDNPGRYKVSLEVKDKYGSTSTTDTVVWAGVKPSVKFDIANRSFYNGNIRYALEVTGIASNKRENIKVFVQYMDRPKQITGADMIRKGEVLLNESDCKACHHHELKSIGPSFKQLADHYSGRADMIPILASKIISGGSGVWGKVNMSAHPQLSMEQANAIVRYIYSLGSQPGPVKQLAEKGIININNETGDRTGQAKTYILTGIVIGDSGEIFKDSVSLRHVKINAAEFDCVSDAAVSDGLVKGRTFSYVCLKNVDLSGVRQIKILASGPIDIRIGSEKGSLVGQAIPADNKGLQPATAVIQPVHGIHDVYFVFGVAKNGFILRQDLKEITFELN